MLLELLLVWTALLVALVAGAIGRPGEGGALSLSYFLGLSLIHVPGVLPFFDSEAGLGDREVTEIGFEMTILGMAAFVSGAILARRIHQRRSTGSDAPPSRRAQALENLGWRALALGGVAYFVLVPLSRSVPSLTSVVLPFGTLLILGLWLRLYGAAVGDDRRRTLATLALLPLLPLTTLVMGGYLGNGICWVLSVVAFLFVIARQRIWFYLGAPLAVFLGLSLFVTYMGQKGAIRELVWQEHASMLDRLARVSAIITEFELLDVSSLPHATALDDRLNQNALVGRAVMYSEDGRTSFAHGATIPPWALIPRAVWPNKPDIGGGSAIVMDFTGITVASSTSFGAGQVLEFFVNFGIPGVLIGFLGLGYLLMWLDQGIMRSLASNDMRGLLLRAMPGLTLLQPGGDLREILVACVAAFLAAHLIISLKFFGVPLAARSRRQLA